MLEAEGDGGGGCGHRARRSGGGRSGRSLGPPGKTGVQARGPGPPTTPSADARR
ncbi:hypothetical protein RC1_0193 [Rhodospirillum centenum SW]|uniref:Uncharacterized protein n=1 Tax=Rhodospirillum centenum (strain ATCC 51521 / SW) TaxID=414684 RepID=B6IQA5_RHOCS|nr:hypothetical protein RC1_0193 [Rhodospirillum centenum SW]